MKNLFNIFLRPNCPLCGRTAADVVCIDCDRQIQASKNQQFQQPQPDFSLFTWSIYDGIIKQAIATCKFKNHPELARFLGIKIGQTWNVSTATRNFSKLNQLKVVPIPMHKEKLKIRGFNQAELLAQGFCNMTGLAIAPQLLSRIKNTKPQIDTNSKQERLDNLNAAFMVNQKFQVKPPSIILFDDIYTTGATIKEAIATLKRSKIDVAAVVVLASPRY